MSGTDDKLAVASSTATGPRRTNQDEAVAVRLQAHENLWGFQALAAVADGMGGHAAGDVASRIAIETVTEVLSLRTAEGSPLVEELGGIEPAEAMARAVRLANLRIYHQAQAEASQHDMGTTLTLVGLTGDTAFVAHIGDSRGYLINESGIHQITQDHSWVARQVREERMTEEQAARSPMRNQVTRTLGYEDNVDPDMLAIPLEPGCIYLVCSDGLTEVISPDEIEETLRTSGTLQEGCEALVEKAVELGTPDNVTVACVEFGHLERGKAAAAPPPHQEITEELYPAAITRARGGSEFDVQRMKPLLGAATVALVIVAALLLRSCLLAPAQQVAEGEQIEPQPASAVELPPIEEGLAIKVLVLDGNLVAAANRHVQITIHAQEDLRQEPRTTFGPTGDYTRALSVEEVGKWAGESCTLKLSVKGDYVHVRTVPEDLDIYVDKKIVKNRRIKASSLTGEPARIGFYFPANDKSGYTVALTQIDAANLPVIDETSSSHE